MPSDDLDRLNSALDSRHILRRELGHGGMATVYLADDVKHSREVAVKVLRPELASALGPDRFTREIAIAAQLNHPHILPLHDSGVAARQPFYVMPFIRGESLRQKLAREKQLSIEDALTITRQVASALDHAHAHNPVHRDIKPENILLHEGQAMVADFGVALALSASPADRLTGAGFALGTPEYMSPEQAAGEPVLDARSDVYSLGCVLYEALAGEPPYTGATAQVVIAKRFTDPVPAVRRLRPEVPAAVEGAIRKALARAPADRFPSCAAFVEALSASAPSQRSPSVAVLPFVNRSSDPANDVIADGITEDVIAQLAKIRSLKVISRTSAMRFKNREESLSSIGASLEVATVLEGSVRRAGDRVRIVAQLLDAETGQHLWAETYDHELIDIFAVQTDVALKIAAALQAELTPDERTRIRREPTHHLRAYQLYLQGRHCFARYTEEGLHQAIEFFERAIEHDPGYALAYAGLAQSYIELGFGPGAGAIRPEDAYRKALTAAEKALELDSDLAEGHSVLGFLKGVTEFDWTAAEQEFRRALQLKPGSADTYDVYGRVLSALQRHDEAIAMMRKAHELDPLAHRVGIVATLLRAGRYDETLETARAAVSFDPHYPLAHATLGWALIMNGDRERGLAELELAVSLAPQNTFFLGQIGQAYGLLGKTAQAHDMLRRMEELAAQRYVSPYHLAYVYTGLGDHEQAISCLERAYDERTSLLYGINSSFLFKPLRSHPRFRALVAKMKLA